jgi:hypothetical protein
MWSVVVRDLWPLLPEITIGLRFVTALIGFVVALYVLARRIRRWLRRRR